MLENAQLSKFNNNDKRYAESYQNYQITGLIYLNMLFRYKHCIAYYKKIEISQYGQKIVYGHVK